MDELLKITDLTFNDEGKNVLDHLNLLLMYNDWYTLVSEGDSAPTILTKIISGLIDNYEGNVEFNFLELNKENLYEIRTRMSILSANLDDNILHDNVYDEIVYELNNMDFMSELKDQFIDDIDQYTNIKEIIDKSVSELTEEEKYILALTTALIIKPKLLVINETFSSLSKELRKKLYSIIKFYKEENKLTVLNITNNLEDTLIGDSIVYLKDGQVEFNEKTTKVYNEKMLTDDIESLPFIVKMSEYLKMYNLVDKNYYDLEEMVAAIWK